jgi:hypothetical protein
MVGLFASATTTVRVFCGLRALSVSAALYQTPAKGGIIGSDASRPESRGLGRRGAKAETPGLAVPKPPLETGATSVGRPLKTRKRRKF